jgi:hypothetical protein
VSVVLLRPSDDLRVCDFCFASEIADCQPPTYDLRPMYRLDGDCVICQRCLDEGRHNPSQALTPCALPPSRG